MQQLPIELHVCIFVGCLPDGPYVEPMGNQAPLLLLQVCRQWRDVALQTPQLWCSLDTVQDYGSEELEPVRWEGMDFYRGWLSRSGNRPLSLGVSFSGHPWLRDEWLEVVQCYRKRFERLRIMDGAGLDVNLLLDGTHMLKHLAIQTQFKEGDRVLTIAQPQPCLHTLILDQLHASPATLLEARWANLTRLAMRLPDEVSYEPDEFIRLLDRYPNLERLIFSPIAVKSLPQPSCPHPNLWMLSIIFDVSKEVDNPLPMLIFPRLLVLQTLYRFEGDIEDALVSEELGPFTLNGPADSSEQASPSTAGLPKRICSIQVEVSDECFAMFDLCWTSITHLDIETTGNTGILGTVLMLCPNLQVLSLHGRHCTACSTSLPGPFSHPTLSSLSTTVWAEFGNLLFAATLPGLNELRIIAASYGWPKDVCAFLICSGCPFETLMLRANHSRVWTTEEQAELRELIPMLTKLELNT